MEKAAKPGMSKTEPQYFSIEALKNKSKTSEPVYSGTCTAKGWGPGKQVTEEEYNTAVKEFCTAPMGKGRR